MVFDSNFNFSNHLSQVIKSTRLHERDLYRIRPLLNLNTAVLLANAFVSSRLDYCNSLFLSLTDFELRRLQLVQNSLCRVVPRSSKFSHITPQLKQAISAREQALCQLCVLSFRAEVTKEKDTKVVPWKWCSEGK